MAKVVRYSLLILGWTIALVLILVFLAVLLLQTEPVRKKLAVVAERQASRFLTGKLSVGSIEGNFYSHLKLNELLLKDQTDTVAFIKSLDVRYNLWPLLNGKLEIRSALLDRPRIRLVQINDSTWNIQQLVKPSESKAEPDSAASNFIVELAAFRLNEGSIKIESADTLIPRRIVHLNTKFSLYWANDRQRLMLDAFSLQTIHPDLQLKQLTFGFSRDSSKMELSQLRLLTANNRLQGKAAYASDRSEKSVAEVQTDSLKLKEFSFFLPGLTLPATPLISLNASIRNDSLHAVLEMSDKGQQIRLDLESPRFTAFLYHPQDSLLYYRLDGDLKHIDLKHWLGQPDLNYRINGHLSAQGAGTDPKTARTRLRGHFTESRIADYPVDKLNLELDYDQGNLKGFAEGSGNFGSFRVIPQIRDLPGNPSYQLELITRNFNLAKITGSDSLQSDINLRARVNGRGFDPRTLYARASLNLTDSRLSQIHADTLFARLQYGRQNIQLDSLWLKTGNLLLGASGNYDLRSHSDLSVTAKFDSINEFAPFFRIDSLQTSGTVRGHLMGTRDSMNLLASVVLNETHYKDMAFESLRLKANALLTKTDTVVQADLVVKNPGNTTIRLDSISAWAEARPDSVFLITQLNNKDLSSRLKTGILPGERLKLILTDWLIDYKNEHWALQNPPTTLEMDSANYRINGFHLASGTADTSQYITADGVVSRTGEEGFKLRIGNLSLARLAEAFSLNMDASGLLDLNVEMNGTAGSPLLNGKFGLRKAVFNQYPLRKLEGQFDYRDNQMKMQTEIVPRDSGSIAFNGAIPLRIHLDSLDFNFNPKDPVEARLQVSRFPLAILNAFVMADEIKGVINGQMTIDGTVESPNPQGRISMKNGSFKMKKYGIDYRTIDFDVKLSPEEIGLDTFLIRSDDGRMTATGKMDFNSVFYKGDVRKSKINLNFNKFNPFDHDQFNMQLSGDASFSSEKGKVVFDGNLNIPQAEIFLPTVLRMFGRMTAEDIPEPILVRQLKKMQEQTDTITIASQEVKKDTTSTGYLDQVTGKIKLKIPRNTWIKSEDMHIELSGDLELRKNKEFFELFGTVNTVRGQYDLLGKTFVIDEGNVTFQGGEEIVPHLDITASYGFRNTDRVEQDLSVHVTGTAESPKVSFTMAGDSINEGDALSYILFGRGMNELTADQQANMAGSGGGTIAGKAAASLITSQISDFLGNKLNMDYLEIKSDAGFENTTVVVGKYITNNLFVSYEQRFGEKNEKDDDVATYEVKLEYELFKFLFLQLNNSSIDSGFDVIFKLNSK